MNMHVSTRWAALLCLAALVLNPAVARGQDQAGITGTVIDETGAALPGTTVEARSPALIEGVRTVFTDGAGQLPLHHAAAPAPTPSPSRCPASASSSARTSC